MNSRERDDLLQFLQPLLRARAIDKDFAAQALILEQCASQPDALYLLVQRAMALDSALQAARARLAELQGSHDSDAGSPDAAACQALQAREEKGNRADAWKRGLLAQAGAIGAGGGVGVAAGVVAGGLLLDDIDDGLWDGT